MSVLSNGEIILYGMVGDNFWDEGFTSREVIEALTEIGPDADVVVRINSFGGYAHEGVSIFNALSMHGGKVTTVVDSMAASSASVIFMAGEERIMRLGSTLMIHDPSTITWGNAEDHERSVRSLNKIADNLASIYASITGEDTELIREEMKEEIWLDGTDAVERGFATSASNEPSIAPTACDYSIFANAPDPLIDMAKSNSWTMADALALKNPVLAKAGNETRHKGKKPMSNKKAPAKSPAPTDAATDPEKSTSIVEAVDNGDVSASSEDRDRIKAILTAPEASRNEDQARYFALETDVAADVAIAALSKLPEASGVTTEVGTYEENRLKAAALAMPNANAGAANEESSLSKRMSAKLGKK